ncbi:MAG: hypothetical protein AAFN70_17535, partial [Planctomycetota bacterium]
MTVPVSDETPIDAETIQVLDLLGQDSDRATLPHAYDILGLTPDTLSSESLKSAYQEIVKHLKERQDSADPKVWKAAGRLVQHSAETLKDGKKRAALDQRLKSSAIV